MSILGVVPAKEEMVESRKGGKRVGAYHRGEGWVKAGEGTGQATKNSC